MSAYAPPLRPPALRPLTVRDRHGRAYIVPGRQWGGLCLHAPHELVDGLTREIPQVRSDKHWVIAHVASGLSVGSVRGSMSSAWLAMVRVALAADWDRPMAEVLADPVCVRIARMLSTLPSPRADEVVP